MLLLSSLLAGCQSPPVAPLSETPASQTVRNNSYSLLHQLLDQEKDITLLRFIKRENTDLKKLLKRVSATAESGEKQLELFAKQDPSIRLDDYRLPPGEVKVRDDISAEEQKKLLHQYDDRLEFTLLLTQIEALNYASHLAKIASENEFDPDRARYLATLGVEMAGLREEVITRVRLNIPATGH